jgi:hypothetical protein
MWIRIRNTAGKYLTKIADPDPHCFWKLDTGPHLNKKRSQWRRGVSKQNPGGSVDQWSQVFNALIRIQICIALKRWNWIRIKVMRIRNSANNWIFHRNIFCCVILQSEFMFI